MISTRKRQRCEKDVEDIEIIRNRAQRILSGNQFKSYEDFLTYCKSLKIDNITANDCRLASKFEYLHNKKHIEDDIIIGAYRMYNYIKCNNIIKKDENFFVTIGELEISYIKSFALMITPRIDLQTEKEKNNEEDSWWIDVESFVYLIEHL